MRPKTVRLEVIECRESGEVGLVLQASKLALSNVDDITVGGGLLLAHDLFEHVDGPENIGGVGEELQALGAMFYVRAANGPLTRGPYHHSAEENIASDVARMYSKWLEDGYEYLVPKTRASCGIEESLKEVLTYTREEVFVEAEYGGLQTDHLDEYLSGVRHFMRVGYRKAKKKYRRVPGHGLYRTFMRVAEEVDSVAAHEDLWPGREFVLTYGLDRVTLEPIYEEY